MLWALVILCLLFLVGGLIFLFDAAFGGLDFASSQMAADAVAKIIRDRYLEKENFYDLGSCRGKFAIKLAKILPGLQIIGIDNSPLRVFSSKLKSIFLKNITFAYGNIFHTDVSLANIVYLYLPQELMPDLQAKLQKELKRGALVISNSVSFPNWQASSIVNLPNDTSITKKLFIYVKE